MGLTDYLLYRLARVWPSPVAERTARIGETPGTEEYATAYTLEQFNRKIRTGLGVAIWDKDCLEIGCGHGGISCFLAVAGARSVTGIDVNTANLEHAERFAQKVARQIGSASLPVRFMEMDAYNLKFEPESFDLVVADNAFEHFMEPEAVMQQAHRVLRKGGGLIVPAFSSIYSKNGPHLKHGLKLPWVHLVFPQRTIIRALRRMADDNPNLLNIYPGLNNGAETFRDLRPYKDLNEITHRKFWRMAERTGFRVERFKPFATTRVGLALSQIRMLRRSLVLDVLSTGAEAYLVKG